MIVSYNGLNYNGFQKQKSANTIQDKLESAIKILTKQNVVCIASGRTDAKVSAYNQPVHFDIDKQIDEKKFVNSINGILPNDIKVLSISPTNLHARFSSKKKTYIYKMYISNIELPLFSNALRISPTLNFKAMKKFTKLIVGTHNFEGFKSSGGQTENNIRTIYSCKLINKGGYFIFKITGNGFLYKMVRNLVGTMLKIGEDKIKINYLKKHLFTDFKATNTARPEYLYLLNVCYK